MANNRGNPRTLLLLRLDAQGQLGGALFDPVSLEVFYLDEAETELAERAPERRAEIAAAAPRQGHTSASFAGSERAPVEEPRPNHGSIAAAVRARLNDIQLSGEVRRLASYRIVVTDRCNMACSYCFVDTNTGKPGLTLDEIKEGFELLFDHNIGRDQVTYQWFGGEPLLKRDLIIEADQIAHDLAKQRGIGRIRPTVVTNGTVLSDKLLAHFVRFGYGVGVSIDGPPEVNALKRQFLSGRHTETVIEKNVDRLIRAGVHTGANVTPTSENWHDLRRSLEYILALGIRFVYVNTPIQVRGYWVADGHSWARQLHRARLYALSKGAMVFSHLDRAYQALDTRLPRVYEHLQQCGGINAALLPGGRISVLDLNWREPDLIFSIAEIRNDPSLLSLARKRLHPIEQCEDCAAAAICGGPSVNDRRLIGSDRPPQEYCRFFVESTRLAALDPSGLQ